LVESFTLANPTCLSADQVTVDGIFVDNISFNNGQFSAATNNLLPEILKDRCQDLYLPTKAFFLITDAGPWHFRATFVLKGTVNTNGRTCCFKVEIKTPECNPRCVNGCSNFAVPSISLPCSINGIAPVINFQFTGAVSMLNPELSFSCNNCGCGVVLETNLVVEPIINVEVIRRTLFCVEACEAIIPCDGSEQQYESLLSEECEEPLPIPCKCGTAPPRIEARERRPVCNWDDDWDCSSGTHHNCSCSCGESHACQHNGCNGCSW